MSTTAAAAVIGGWLLNVLTLTYRWGMGTKVTRWDELGKAQEKLWQSKGTWKVGENHCDMVYGKGTGFENYNVIFPFFHIFPRFHYILSHVYPWN